MGVGLGSQMSFVNITMQALSSGFQIPNNSTEAILNHFTFPLTTSKIGIWKPEDKACIVKGNVKWLSIASVLLLVIGLIFG
jgi:hypothetical protein